MDPKLVDKISSEISRRYPEFAGKRPKVTRPTASANSQPDKSGYLLTYSFKTRVNSSQGSRSMTRTLRVLADENGKILKVSTSR